MFRHPLRLNFALEHTHPDYVRTGEDALNFHAIRVEEVLRARTPLETLRTLHADRQLLFDRALASKGNLSEIMLRLTRLMLVRLQEVPESYFRRHPASVRAALQLLQTALEYWRDQQPELRRLLEHSRDVLRKWRAAKKVSKIKTNKPTNPFHGGPAEKHR
jgi:hypothetical protein